MGGTTWRAGQWLVTISDGFSSPLVIYIEQVDEAGEARNTTLTQRHAFSDEMAAWEFAHSQSGGVVERVVLAA